MSPSRFARAAGGWSELPDRDSSSGGRDDDDADGSDDEHWGLGKGMELFEASAKDGQGERGAAGGVE
jgi:hypothetical protein